MAEQTIDGLDDLVHGDLRLAAHAIAGRPARRFGAHDPDADTTTPAFGLSDVRADAVLVQIA
jgi:hypothetical protein